MRVQALRSFYGDEGNVRRGQIIDVTDYRGAALIRRGLVAEVQLAGVADNGKVRPMDGGPTGEEKPASSLRRGRVRKTCGSKSRKGGQER